MATDGTGLVHLYYEKFLTSPGQLDLADQIMASDVVFHNPISTGIFGIDEYKKFALRWYHGFPDRVFTVRDTVAQGDKVAAAFTITGTHQGEFMGAAPTGHTIVVNGMNLFRIEQGRIKDVQAFFNPDELYEPLGLKR